MNLVFSGTRDGHTPRQMDILEWFVNQHGTFMDLVRIGCAHGADEEFFHLVRRLAPNITMEFHPCNYDRMRWAMRMAKPDEIVHPVRPALERNRTMVDHSTYLLAGGEALHGTTAQWHMGHRASCAQGRQAVLARVSRRQQTLRGGAAVMEKQILATCGPCGYAFIALPNWNRICPRCQGRHTFPHPEPQMFVGILEDVTGKHVMTVTRVNENDVFAQCTCGKGQLVRDGGVIQDCRRILPFAYRGLTS